MDETRNVKLNNYQKEFTESFFNLTSKRNHLLLAPVGSGKSITIAVIVDRLISKGAQRILVLTSAKILVDQYKYIFNEYVKSSRFMVLSRKTLREYETLKMQGLVFPQMIVVGTWENAELEDAGELITSTKWDLIIIDEVHFSPGSQRASHFYSIIAEVKSDYKLVVSDPFDNNKIKQILGEKYETFEGTRWSRKELISSERSSRPHEVRNVYYTRTTEEITFIRGYVNLVKSLAMSNLEQKVQSRLVSSSLFAAEESLRNMRNRLVHRDLEIFSSEDSAGIENIKDEELLGDVNIYQSNADWSEQKINGVTEHITSTINSLDLIQVDSKFNALLNYLKEHTNQSSRVWIYASYTSTLTYLFSSLKESFEKIHVLHGQMPTSDVQAELSEFKIDGGILIASTNLLKGVDLNLDTLVFYDVPGSENLLYFILSRSTLPDDNSFTLNPIEVAIMNDVSGVLRSEKARDDRLKKILESTTSDTNNV